MGLTDDPTAAFGSVEPIAIAYRNKNDLDKLYARFDHRGTTTGIGDGIYPYVDLKFSDPCGGVSSIERDATGVGDFNGNGQGDFVVRTVSGYEEFEGRGIFAKSLTWSSGSASIFVASSPKRVSAFFFSSTPKVELRTVFTARQKSPRTTIEVSRASMVSSSGGENELDPIVHTLAGLQFFHQQH